MALSQVISTKARVSEVVTSGVMRGTKLLGIAGEDLPNPEAG